MIYTNSHINPEALKWYNTLNLNQKINLKDCAVLLVGAEFSFLIKLFNLKEVISILYNKLKLEGFDV